MFGRVTRADCVNGYLAEARERAETGLELMPGFTDLVFEQAYSYVQ